MQRYWTLGMVMLLVGCQRGLPTQGGAEVRIPGGSEHFAVQNIPNTLPVYSIPPSTRDAGTVAADASVFGVRGDVQEGQRFSSVHLGTSWFLAERKTGAEFYQDRDGLWGGMASQTGPGPDGAPLGPIAAAPDLAASRRMADAFLSAHAPTGLGSAVFYRENEMGESVSNALQPGMSESKITCREFQYKRSIDGLVLHGPASQISVFVGPAGKIVGYFSDWPTLIAGGAVELQGSSAALGGMKARIDHLNSLLVPGKRILSFRVDKVALGYVGYLNPDGSRDVIPTYAVLGQADHENGPRTEVIYLTAAPAAPIRDPEPPSPADPVQPPPPPLAR